MNWKEIGAGSASGGGVSNNSGYSTRPSMSINGSGNPVIAWQDNTSGNVEIYVKQWTGLQWEELAGSAAEGGVSNNSGDSCKVSLAVDYSGNIFVAWSDFSVGYGGIYVRVWDGSSWTGLGGSTSEGGISNVLGKSMEPSVVSKYSGDIAVAWYNETSNSDQIYMKQWTNN